jgi:hypothetical protein
VLLLHLGKIRELAPDLGQPPDRHQEVGAGLRGGQGGLPRRGGDCVLGGAGQLHGFDLGDDERDVQFCGQRPGPVVLADDGEQLRLLPPQPGVSGLLRPGVTVGCRLDERPRLRHPAAEHARLDRDQDRRDAVAVPRPSDVAGLDRQRRSLFGVGQPVDRLPVPRPVQQQLSGVQR